MQTERASIDIKKAMAYDLEKAFRAESGKDIYTVAEINQIIDSYIAELEQQ
jgi:hypothetical protein